ncbi:ATP-binding response regulator, partial [Coprothermobacter proteolyticus]
SEGSVILKAEMDKDRENDVIFSVTDTGIGIPEEHISDIFQEFRQVDGTISRKYGGTGLGLSISKKLADLMKGEIEVRSKIGEGSTFFLKLPGLVCKKEDGREKVTVKKDMDRKISTDRKNDKVILVIEDNENFAKYLKEINDGMGFDTIIAGSGKEGLETAKNTRVDGILLDIMLPDMSGIEVLRELKSIVELGKIPVHVISDLEEDDVSQIIAYLLNYSARHPERIMIVGGDAIWQSTIKKPFEERNITTKTVSTEEEVKFEFKKEMYDAVILNMELDDKDVAGICEYIAEQNVDIPLIVYAEKSLSQERQKEIKKYADKIIIKTADSKERFQDELTAFLKGIKENMDNGCYLFSKVKKEYALNLDGKTIMIVDDDHRNVFVLAAALEDYGANIIAAENGKMALELLRTNKV